MAVLSVAATASSSFSTLPFDARAVNKPPTQPPLECLRLLQGGVLISAHPASVLPMVFSIGIYGLCLVVVSPDANRPIYDDRAV